MIEWKNLEALGVGEPENLAELSPTEGKKKTATSSGRRQESGRSCQRIHEVLRSGWRASRKGRTVRWP